MGRRDGDEWDESGDEIADNWEEELDEEEKKKEQPVAAPPSKPRRGKKEETPRAAEEELFESEADRKIRQEAAVKRSDLQNTIDLFGVSGVSVDQVLQDEMCRLSVPAATRHGHFEAADPHSIPEFEKYAEYIAGHVTQSYGDRKNYHSFLDCLIRRLLQARDLGEVRSLAATVQELAASKQKEQRPVASAAAATAITTAPPKQTKKKPSLLLGAKKGRDVDMTDYGSINYGDDDY